MGFLQIYCGLECAARHAGGEMSVFVSLRRVGTATEGSQKEPPAHPARRLRSNLGFQDSDGFIRRKLVEDVSETCDTDVCLWEGLSLVTLSRYLALKLSARPKPEQSRAIIKV